MAAALENYYDCLHRHLDNITNEHPNLEKLGNSKEEIIYNLDSIASDFENIEDMLKDFGVNVSLVNEKFSDAESNSDLSLVETLATFGLGTKEYNDLKSDVETDGNANKKSSLKTRWNDLVRQKDILVQQLETFPEFNLHMLRTIGQFSIQNQNLRIKRLKGKNKQIIKQRISMMKSHRKEMIGLKTMDNKLNFMKSQLDKIPPLKKFLDMESLFHSLKKDNFTFAIIGDENLVRFLAEVTLEKGHEAITELFEAFNGPDICHAKLFIYLSGLMVKAVTYLRIRQGVLNETIPKNYTMKWIEYFLKSEGFYFSRCDSVCLETYKPSFTQVLNKLDNVAATPYALQANIANVALTNLTYASKKKVIDLMWVKNFEPNKEGIQLAQTLHIEEIKLMSDLSKFDQGLEGLWMFDSKKTFCTVGVRKELTGNIFVSIQANSPIPGPASTLY